ncbi:hypothetical protein [Plantibacter sp. YIM 135249]|uniref:hypothetical protein n=1 Tax=Plantibacter sp. YIM 135249 TaxID=3423918 RepID=UPI003D350049
MNSPTDTQNQSPTSPSAQRPLGYWLRTIDVSMRSAMRDAFAEQGIGRRSWRTLSVIADGASTIDEIDAAMPPRRGPHGRKGHEGRGRFGGRGFGGRPEHRFGERPEQGFGERPERGEHPFASPEDRTERPERSFGPRGQRPEHPFGARGQHPFAERAGHPDLGGRPGHPDRAGRPEGSEHPDRDRPGHCGPESRRRRSTQDIVDEFVDRGWVTTEDGIALTDAGREAHAALLTKVTAIRSTVTDAVSPEDFATTMASLESIARGFGWDESTASERGPRGRREHGPRGHRTPRDAR